MWWTSVIKTALAATSAIAVATVVWAVPSDNGAEAERGALAPAAGAAALVASAEGDAAAPEAPPAKLARNAEEVKSGAQEQEARAQLADAIAMQRDQLVRLLEKRTEKSIELEQGKIETWLLQREMEQLHAAYIALELTEPEKRHPNPEIHEQRLRELARKLEEAKERLRRGLAESARREVGLDLSKLEVSLAEAQLTDLSQLRSQMEFEELTRELGRESNDRASGGVHDQRLGIARESRIPADVFWRHTPGRNNLEVSDKIQSQDVLRIEVLGAPTDQPIAGNFDVEEMGTVALGPAYGRVKVAGMSVLEAEEAIKKHLSETVENPEVQVTLVHANRSGSSSAPVTAEFRPQKLDEQQFQQAVTAALANIHQEVEALRAADSLASGVPRQEVSKSVNGPSVSATDERIADVRVIGNRDISTARILDQLQTRAGQFFDPVVVQRDVRKLASRGWFDDVEPSYEQSSKGRVVIFQVVERLDLDTLKPGDNIELVISQTDRADQVYVLKLDSKGRVTPGLEFDRVNLGGLSPEQAGEYIRDAYWRDSPDHKVRVRKLEASE